MKFLKKPLALFIAFSLLFINCKSGAKVVGDKLKKPLNIILMIGDGMGLAQISAASFINGGLSLDLLTTLGLINTSSANNYITDSAAGATAYSTGQKSYNGAIGVGVDSVSLITILEMAEKNNLATGIVTTCSITHATPACFYAHQPSRTMDKAIANDFYGKGIDLAIGGGKPYFDMEKLKADGYTIATGPNFNWQTNASKYFYFYDDSLHLPSLAQGRGDFLLNATKKAMGTLNNNKKGFFLMVEGSQIDWGGHDNNFDYVVQETIDFDKAIKAAIDFAKADGNTLVIITADHETAGLALNKGSLKNKTIEHSFATGSHSGIMVPIYAFGPGSHLFAGTMHNTKVFDHMKFLFGF